MKAQLVNTEPSGRTAWIIKKDGEFYAANIYTNQIANASELTQEETDTLKEEVQNTKYEIEIFEP